MARGSVGWRLMGCLVLVVALVLLPGFARESDGYHRAGHGYDDTPAAELQPAQPGPPRT